MLPTAVVLAAAGFAAARLVTRPVAARAPEALLVRNYRGHPVPAVGGVVLFLSVLFCWALMALLGPDQRFSFWKRGPAALTAAPTAVSGGSMRAGMMLLTAGFFALGLIDDLSTGSHAKGLRGHLRALKKGTFTTGLVKAAGGVALAVLVSAMWTRGLGRTLLGGLTVAAFANLVNLTDLRPGRACKLFLLAWIPLTLLAASRATGYLFVSAALTGAVVHWLGKDLKEEGMLGDAGSNVLGAVLGAGVILTFGVTGQLVALAAALVLTAASEKFSFTEAIARTPALRWIDRLGRWPE